MRAVLIVALVATSAGCAERGKTGTIERDVRCFALASASFAELKDDENLLLLTGYYLGRAEAGDPSGGWRADVAPALQELSAEPDKGHALVTDCVATMRRSIRSSGR